MNTPGDYKHVSPADVEALLASDTPPLIIDVRDDWEYQRYHIPDAMHIPLDEIAMRTDEVDEARAVVCVCEHGMRSETAASFLAGSGFTDVSTMDGGMAAYEGKVMSGE